MPRVHSLDELGRCCDSANDIVGFLDLDVPEVRPLPFFVYGTGSLIAIVSGQHGDEPSGPATAFEIRKRLQDLDSTPVRVLGLPILNGPAVHSHTRVWCGDRLDMNRMFDPIETQNGPTAQIARKLLDGLSRLPIFLLLDLHAGGDHELLTHIRAHEDNGREVWAGLRTNWIQRFRLPRGFLIRAFSERGIPAFAIEVGGSGFDADEVTATADRVVDLLSSYGLRRDDSVESPVQLLRTILRPLANNAGYFQRTARLGTRLIRGEEIGHFRTFPSWEQDTVHAGSNGVLASTARDGFVSATTTLYEILDSDKDQIAVEWVY